MRVYDKLITLQRQSDIGDWVNWKILRAFVNKTKGSTSSLTFEVRYTQSLKEIFSYMDEFIIVYRGDVYLIEDCDDYMESHQTLKLKTSILRLGKFSSEVSILKKNRTQDDEGFTTMTLDAVETVRCYHENRQGSTRLIDQTTYTEVTDLFQIKKPTEYKLSRGYLLECDGEYFEILSIERIKGYNLYLQILARCIEGAVS